MGACITKATPQRAGGASVLGASEVACAVPAVELPAQSDVVQPAVTRASTASQASSATLMNKVCQLQTHTAGRVHIYAGPLMTCFVQVKSIMQDAGALSVDGTQASCIAAAKVLQQHVEGADTVRYSMSFHPG
jgi:hypothetical protein